MKERASKVENLFVDPVLSTDKTATTMLTHFPNNSYRIETLEDILLRCDSIDIAELQQLLNSCNLTVKKNPMHLCVYYY